LQNLAGFVVYYQKMNRTYRSGGATVSVSGLFALEPDRERRKTGNLLVQYTVVVRVKESAKLRDERHGG